MLVTVYGYTIETVEGELTIFTDLAEIDDFNDMLAGFNKANFPPKYQNSDHLISFLNVMFPEYCFELDIEELTELLVLSGNYPDGIYCKLYTGDDDDDDDEDFDASLN